MRKLSVYSVLVLIVIGLVLIRLSNWSSSSTDDADFIVVSDDTGSNDPEHPIQEVPSEHTDDQSVDSSLVFGGESANDAAELGVGTEPESQLVDALLRRLMESGALTESVDELDAEFEQQNMDQAWGRLQEITIQTEFANQDDLRNYYFTILECRETLCRGRIRTVDGTTFDVNGIASLANAAQELRLVNLEAISTSGFGASSAKIYFSRGH